MDPNCLATSNCILSCDSVHMHHVGRSKNVFMMVYEETMSKTMQEKPYVSVYMHHIYAADVLFEVFIFGIDNHVN